MLTSALLTAIIIRSLFTVDVDNLDDDGYPLDFNMGEAAYGCGGQFWYNGIDSASNRSKYELDPPYSVDDDRIIYWDNNRWICRRSTDSYVWQHCDYYNLFDCSFIRYKIFATNSDGYYSVYTVSSYNGFNVYQRTNGDRYIYYDSNELKWKLSNSINGSVVYGECVETNIFKCNYPSATIDVQTGAATLSPSHSPTSYPTYAPICNCSCPPSQTVDTHRLCHIFADADLSNLSAFQSRDFSDDNYCNWEMFSDYKSMILCDSASSETIKKIGISGLDGTLNFSQPWPSSLREIDLEQYSPYDRALEGEWNWESLRSLKNLTEIDLEDNLFAGELTDDIWNTIASLPSLQDIVLRGNNFETNFSSLVINATSTTLTNLELSYNNFYGTMDIASFFSSFPALRKLKMTDDNIHGHFDNFDVFQNMRHIQIDHNHFSGHLKMSHGVSFHPRLEFFEIDYNTFTGSVSWHIFENMYNLTDLDINGNDFTGTIDWNTISDLVNNGVLSYIDLHSNRFSRFVDFSWIHPSDNIDFYLDEDVFCDPVIHPCAQGVPVNRYSTYCRSRITCQLTCQCATYPPSDSPTSLILLCVFCLHCHVLFY